jgi:glycosyltransferase involved in cell wall biosynthesis
VGLEAPIRVAWLTNVLAPYRLPMLRQLGSDPDLQLEIWSCAENEVSRNWDNVVQASEPFSMRGIRGFTWSKYDAGRGQFQILHLRWEIFKHMARWKPAVIVLGDASWTRYLASWAAGLHGIPTIFWSEDTPWNQSRRWYIRTLYRRALSRSRIAVVPGRVSYDFIRSLGFDKKRIVVAPNSVDVEFFRSNFDALQASRPLIRRHFRCEDDEIIILFPARLVGFKRPQLVVETVANVTRFRKIRCLVAGEGPELRNCKELAENLGVADRFTWLGQVDVATLCRLYLIADVLLLCSMYEPWGMVINECQAFGLPCVVTENVGAAPDMIFPENGRVASSSPLDLSRAIEEARQIPRTIVAEMGRKLCDKFSPTKQADGFRQAIKAAISCRQT